MKKSQEEILIKYQQLNKTREQLKKEFVGIDKVIDEVMEAISSWYLFPNLQEKPLIVNLWGLTGVGKSSLVRRLTELLEFENRAYEFDLGESSEENTIKSTFEDISNELMGKPMVLTFDEFQYARTKSPNGEEMKNSYSRIIWQLFDNGKFPMTKFNVRSATIYNQIKDLTYLIKMGVRVKNGKVVRQKQLFFDYFNSGNFFREKSQYDPEADILFIDNDFYDDITEIAPAKYPHIYNVEQLMFKMDEAESVKFLEEILELSLKPKIIDCSKALIFVLGNLDEAYLMSADYNPDMDADEFHEQTLKISVLKIKKALRKRFRNEHIARLGNLHILYPAFNKSSFYRIIDLELEKISRWFLEEQHILLQFDASLKTMIYQEGVYPTQGTRPVYSTIHHLVKTSLGRIAIEISVKDLASTHVNLKIENKTLIIDFYNNHELLHSLFMPVRLNLNDLRENKKDDMQAIVAVHESGHAIIAAILLKTIPEVMFSVTTDTEGSGFVYTKFKWKYISRKEILNRVALFLGGYCAEKLIFGEENVTTGAEKDIANATYFVTDMLKSCGMGSSLGAFHNPGNETLNFIYDTEMVVNSEAQNWLKKAMELAEGVLEKQRGLLLKMSNYLSDERTMSKELIRNYIVKYAIDFDPEDIVDNGDLLFYRDHLKKKVSQLIETSAGTYEMKLNRNSLS